MHDYLAARTAFFDRAVTGALGRGMAQVVVGAAGYDGRAFRYAKPGVRWFEVDHPATQRDKLRRLERLGIDAAGVRFVEADFTRDPVAGRLRAAGLDPDTPSLFLLEGVAVYLEPAVLEDVLGQFRQVAAPGSRLAISVSLSRPPGDADRARFQAAVAALGEPARSTLARPLHPGRDRCPPGFARTAGRRPAAAPVRRARAVSGQLARRGPPPGRLAALPDGAAPRRLSGRQLTRLRARE
jgi:methyltransferase (TIGR00027 family)